MSGGESLFSSGAGTLAAVALLMALLALGGIGLLLARQQRLAGKYEHLMRGTSGGNLEAMLNDHVSQVREVAGRTRDLNQVTQRLQQGSLQHLAMVRFNPFQDTGGDQSFAIALADGEGNGVVLSSLHSRHVTRVYAKPLQEWGSTHSLTEEEKQAILLAQQATR